MVSAGEGGDRQTHLFFSTYGLKLGSSCDFREIHKNTWTNQTMDNQTGTHTGDIHSLSMSGITPNKSDEAPCFLFPYGAETVNECSAEAEQARGRVAARGESTAASVN